MAKCEQAPFCSFGLIADFCAKRTPNHFDTPSERKKTLSEWHARFEYVVTFHAIWLCNIAVGCGSNVL